ncbi:hypothetical protein H0H93_011501 [Arthromyces matolae]|nr:hypothetical protein H0H93_011501 [Arthromyces matolae]
MSGWDSDEYEYASSTITRDGFTYNGTTFCVEVDHHRHPRCESADLYALLTWTDPGPRLTKAGKVAKKQPEPHKDNPLHFYEAQCLHYGLKQYKTRPAAKKHLLEAFDVKTKIISVPTRIIALEKAMKEEYRVANEAALKRIREENARQEARRQAWIEQEAKRKADEADSMVKEFAAAGIVIANARVADLKGRPHVNKTSKSKMTDDQLRQSLNALTEAQKRLEDTCDDRGEYMIIAPYLRKQWSSQTDEMSLKMSPSLGSSHLWISFNFGIYSGVMRSFSFPPKHVGDTVDLHWKGREEGEGESCFGDEEVASITFLGGGKIRGRVRCPLAGTVEFIGKKMKRSASDTAWEKQVSDWKKEYRRINERSHAADGARRWGTWCDPGSEKDMTSNSDTASDRDADLSGDEEDNYDFKADEKIPVVVVVEYRVGIPIWQPNFKEIILIIMAFTANSTHLTQSLESEKIDLMAELFGDDAPQQYPVSPSLASYQCQQYDSLTLPNDKNSPISSTSFELPNLYALAPEYASSHLSHYAPNVPFEAMMNLALPLTTNGLMPVYQEPKHCLPDYQPGPQSSPFLYHPAFSSGAPYLTESLPCPPFYYPHPALNPAYIPATSHLPSPAPSDETSDSNASQSSSTRRSQRARNPNYVPKICRTETSLARGVLCDTVFRCEWDSCGTVYRLEGIGKADEANFQDRVFKHLTEHALESQGNDMKGRMRAPACGTFEFIGKKGPKNNVVWVKSVDSWKSRYRGINEGAYEAANSARWGGGWYDSSGDSREMTPNSDTGTEDDESEEDEEDSEDGY